MAGLVANFQSALKNAPLRHRANKEPITDFVGTKQSPPIKTFMNTDTRTPVVVTDVAYESSMKTEALNQQISSALPKTVNVRVSQQRKENLLIYCKVT